jgi:transcriptional regulator with XRE-family HTH domain
LQLPVRRSRIPELLRRKKLKQVDLAKHLGVTEGYVSQLINLLTVPNVDTLRKIAQYLDCVMDDLYEWID